MKRPPTYSKKPPVIHKPPALPPGGRIGVVAPAGCVDLHELERGLEAIRSRGFETELAPAILERKGYLAGDGQVRARDLLDFFLRDDIDAIICARGGFGSIQLLPYLARDLRRHPKIFCGYSDITVLLNWFLQRYGFVTFHAPMVAMDLAKGLSARASEHFWKVLTGERSSWSLPLHRTIQSGKSEAVIVGGCLSLLVTTLGTPYEIDTSGKILFLEDVGEKPYRVERMLIHLKCAGKFESLAGLVLGDFTACEGDGPRTVDVLIDEMFHDAGYPVLAGAPAGHGAENLTLPLGARMQLDGGSCSLALMEPPVTIRRPAGG